MSVVVDASVALKSLLDEPGSEAIDALLEQELVAPALAAALRENTYVVTVDRRFKLAIDQSPELSGSVRLLGTLAELAP